MTGENGRRTHGAARRQGSDLQLSAWQEGTALKTLSLRAQCSEGLTMTMSLSEKHHAVDPHRAVPAAPPDHQGTDGGAAGGRGRRGSPPEGVSGEAAQVGLQVGRQGGGPEAREGAPDTAMARRRPAASTRSRGTTLRGRAGDRGEGRVERGESGYTYSNAG